MVEHNAVKFGFVIRLHQLTKFLWAEMQLADCYLWWWSQPRFSAVFLLVFGHINLISLALIINFLVNFSTCDVMHGMMPSHHHPPLTICSKRLIKCWTTDFCACNRLFCRVSGVWCVTWRLLTDPRSLLTTTRRMLRHSSDCTHRDSSDISVAQSLRIQAANAAILGLRAPRVTLRGSSAIFARQAWNQNHLSKITRTSLILEYRRPDRCTPDRCVTSEARSFW